MKPIRMLALFVALPVLALTAAGCAGPFDTCVKPYTSQITWTGTVTELGDVVGAFLLCDPTWNGGEAPVCALESLNQLESTLGPDGAAIINCAIKYWQTYGTVKQQAAAKAVGAKRSVDRAAMLRCPALAKTPTACEGSNCVATADRR